MDATALEWIWRIVVTLVLPAYGWLAFKLIALEKEFTQFRATMNQKAVDYDRELVRGQQQFDRLFDIMTEVREMVAFIRGHCPRCIDLPEKEKRK